MTESIFGVGSYVALSRTSAENFAVHFSPPKSDLYGRVVALVGTREEKDGIRLVMFDAGCTWGYPFDQLSERYQKLIREANVTDFNPDFQSRKYCGIRQSMLKDGSRLHKRVSTTVAKLRASGTGEGYKILDKVQPDEVLYGSVVDPGMFRQCSIVMFDESDKYGYLLEDMNITVQNEIARLNIPNVHKRRFICASHSDLSFIDSSSSIQARKNTMSNKIVETLKGDAKEAAYRVAGTQITNGVKLGVVKLFESKGGTSEHMKMLTEVLDSEVGDSLIALLLGYGLNYAPGLKEDPRIQKLSEEFRINGMAVAGNAIVGAAMESFLPVLTGALSALPVEETSKPRISESSEEEEEEEVVPPARASKRA
eukprot:gnl/Spiro4/12551_TR6641_c0_g1_i1.p1 gnl/Spiro4/12551_TR6641_c0_g1~~gnl/Spiro4/12551_TR6641_c0_g1_i1.p1  ORF type:complete len:368 (-),score=-0.65 gnl/Spiro4/12551_TR6641_c0_g1_i1:707-1810(-)